MHANVLLQMCDFGIANVGTVQKRDQVQQGELKASC